MATKQSLAGKKHSNDNYVNCLSSHARTINPHKKAVISHNKTVITQKKLSSPTKNCHPAQKTVIPHLLRDLRSQKTIHPKTPLLFLLLRHCEKQSDAAISANMDKFSALHEIAASLHSSQ